jgi:hypothetical protein
MLYKVKLRKFVFNLVTLVLIFSIVVDVPKVMAASDAEMLQNGNFYFNTTDTEATTNITWETIGFTVRRDVSNGNPLKDNKYATFMLKSGQKTEKDLPGGKKSVTFFLTKSQVNAALKGTDLETIKDNDVLYLNGIIKVKNGTKAQDTYYTLDGIKGAEDWYNTKDFDDRFDVRIYYEAGDPEYPVKITYQLYQSGNYISDGSTYYKNEDQNSDTPVLFKTHDDIKVTYKNISKSRTVGKDTYYLYRVYYQDLPSKKVLGNRKLASHPILDETQYNSDLAYIRNRTFTIQGAETDDSLNIVAIYRRFPVNEGGEDSEEMTKEYEETDPTGVIGADTRGNELYDVTEGIPGTESLYANAFTSKYLAGSTFTRKYGEKVYNVNVKKTYNLQWTTTEKDPKTGKDKEIDHSSTRTMTYTYQIKRPYSYWIINSLGVYGIDKAVIQNKALPGGSVILTPSGYIAPTASYVHNDSEASHIKEPEIKEVSMPSQTLTGTGSEPSIPSENFKDKAEESVKKIKCKNDTLIFNGQTIMSGTEKEDKTDTPIEIPSGLEEIGENVLYKSSMVIPGTLANGEYESSGTVTYKPIVTLNSSDIETTYELSDINNVVVHTPTVCDAQVQNNFKDNQMITPDKSRASLVLDRSFYVTLPTTGSHNYIKGYGYRDYAKYINDRQVRFPFDVYRGSSTTGTFIPSNTWTSVSENTQFFLPTWVKEGKYTISFSSAAINTYANNKAGYSEKLANSQLENYVATDTVDVEVSGRIYGLNLYDISDYPLWEKVFRLSNSLKTTGFNYKVGTKDQNGNNNGQNSKYTLALVNGSHPTYQNIGTLKTGYVTRFSLKTVGDMYGINDYIRIKPTFYYVNKNGENRQEVDIYYSETFNGKKNLMVKVGSELDLNNKKSLYTDDPYLAIPDVELNQTAYYKGVDIKEWKAQRRNVFTLSNIMIPESLRTFVGYLPNLPASVTEKAVAQSVQNWYGEYYLPSDIHVTPRDFDITEYFKNNGGFTYKEPFWLKDGYIIVNFAIESIQDGKRHLSYINPINSGSGYLNMWKREGFQYQKTDYHGSAFNFEDGDYILYHSNSSAAKDYISSGTH